MPLDRHGSCAEYVADHGLAYGHHQRVVERHDGMFHTVMSPAGNGPQPPGCERSRLVSSRMRRDEVTMVPCAPRRVSSTRELPTHVETLLRRLMK